MMAMQTGLCLHRLEIVKIQLFLFNGIALDFIVYTENKGALLIKLAYLHYVMD